MPRVRKNPFMSLWLSAANRLGNTGRGVLLAASRRERAAMSKAAVSTAAGFWTRALTAATAPRRRRK